MYDLSNKLNALQRPLFKSHLKSGKHSDPVWEVKWLPNDMDDNLNFISCSTDGRVTNWTVLKNNELVGTDIIKLQRSKDGSGGALSGSGSLPLSSLEHLDQATGSKSPTSPTSSSLNKFSGATCLDVNRTNPDMFIVGTEDGKLYKCSKAYNRQYLTIYEPHQLGVYSVRYSPYVPYIFLSASADWTVKLWHHDLEKPVLTFDLGQSVGDISWSPFSSSVFSAVTSDGRVSSYTFYEH